MPIPVDKLVGVTTSKYEFTCACIRLVDKAGGTQIGDIELDNWKIVPKVLELMLGGEFHYHYRENEVILPDRSIPEGPPPAPILVPEDMASE